MADSNSERTAVRFAASLPLSGARWVAGLVAGLVWKIVFNVSVGMFIGLVVGIAYGLITGAVGLNGALESIHVPPFLYKFVVVVASVVAFGFFGLVRAAKSTARGAASGLVDTVWPAVESAAKAGGGESASRIDFEGLERGLTKFVEDVGPAPGAGFVTRRARRFAAAAAEKVKAGILESCRESAKADPDGRLMVDGFQAARAVARRHAAEASAGSVGRSLAGPGILIGVVLAVLYLLPLLLLLKG